LEHVQGAATSYGCVYLPVPGLTRINCDGFILTNQFVNTLFQTALYVNSRAYLNTVGFFNCTGEGLRVATGGYCSVIGKMVGRDNTGSGLAMRRSAVLGLDLAATVSLTGATGDIVLYNGIGTWTWADVPFWFGQRAGTVTLVAGDAIVISKNMPADARIVVARNTAGGASGTLAVPQASRINLGTPTAQFEIVSSNPADTSTVDWFWQSATMGNGGVFRESI
jgi:hypothetical protein